MQRQGSTTKAWAFFLPSTYLAKLLTFPDEIWIFIFALVEKADIVEDIVLRIEWTTTRNTWPIRSFQKTKS